MKQLYAPRFKTRDIIFISKTNELGKDIKKFESARLKFQKKLQDGTPLKYFSHASISQHDALFVETGVNTGGIQTSIDELLEIALKTSVIDYWEVYRCNNTFDVKSDTKFYNNVNERYYHSLYNTSFTSTEERDSYFCSQLVSDILQRENLLDIQPTNVGPTELYLQIKNSPNIWTEVTHEYKDILENPDYLEDRARFLARSKSFASAQSAVSFSQELTADTQAMVDQILQRQPSSATNRLASPTGVFNNQFNKYLVKKKEQAREEGKLPQSVLNIEAKFQEVSDLHKLSTDLVISKEEFHRDIKIWMKDISSYILSKIKNDKTTTPFHQDEIQSLRDEINQIISDVLSSKSLMYSEKLQNDNKEILNNLNHLLHILSKIETPS